jgi:hypothetical protein
MKRCLLASMMRLLPQIKLLFLLTYTGMDLSGLVRIWIPAV